MTYQRNNLSPAALWPVAVFGAGIAALYLARGVCIPFVFALTLSFLLAPSVGWLERRRLPRVLAVMTVMTFTVLTTIAVGWVMTNQMIEAVNRLPEYRENIRTKLEAFRAPSNSPLARAAKSMEELGKEFTAPRAPAPALTPAPPGRKGERAVVNTAAVPVSVKVVEQERTGFAYLRELVGPFLTPVTVLGIILILAIFMLIEREDLRDRLLRLAGVGQLPVMTQALNDASARVSRYLLLQFSVNAALGLIFGLGLYWIGLPYAALWGAGVAILRMVPYAGFPAAAFLPMVLSLAVFDSWMQPAMIFVLGAALELSVANFVEPWLYGSHTGISSLGLLVATIFWTILWGPAGLVLSTPLTVCLVVLGRHAPQLSFLHILLGDEPVLPPEARLYQRLLKMDQVEAQMVVDSYLKDHSMLEMYDSVIIPMLFRAEQDRRKGLLEPSQEEFLFLSVSEMVSELGERHSLEEPSANTPPTGVPGGHGFTGRVLIVPLEDEADEVAGGMLGQLLERAGCGVVALQGEISSGIELLKAGAGDTICVSALAPTKIARAITLCSQHRSKFPEANIMLGLWGFSGNHDLVLRRLQRARGAVLVTTLAQAMEHLNREQPVEINAGAVAVSNPA
ncbi:MAG TPA: AI-2E family transporter [Bryobacteraceae bacterium]|nr:AI-2E family transporter [Bryobacteraceae bacterium]